MKILHFVRHNTPKFGLAGAGVVSVCILISAVVYRGSSGESYSLLNHFISELGEVGISSLAWLFNAGLVAGGLLFLPFSFGLGLGLPGWLSKIGMVAGVVAAISLSGVGFFTMNNLEPHVTAATTYFRSGLVTVLFFGLAILFQPKENIVLDKRANLASLAAVICYSMFLIFMETPPDGSSSSFEMNMVDRPDVWVLAVLEWLVFFSTILWFFVIAITKRGDTQSIRQPCLSC